MEENVDKPQTSDIPNDNEKFAILIHDSKTKLWKEIKPETSITKRPILPKVQTSLPWNGAMQPVVLSLPTYYVVPSLVVLNPQTVPVNQANNPEDSKRMICRWVEPAVSGSPKTCDEAFTVTQKLVTHLRGHISRCESTNFVCHWENCQRNKTPFSRKAVLNDHVCLHAGFKPLCCTRPGCQETFATGSALDRHIQEHSMFQFPCKFPGCSQVFFSINTQKYHHREHCVGDQRYKCTVAGCGKTFATNGTLRIHLLTHTEEKPFECAVAGCNRKFRRNCDLTWHMRTHGGKVWKVA